MGPHTPPLFEGPHKAPLNPEFALQEAVSWLQEKLRLTKTI